MSEFNFAIIRPYITLPSESAGVDRYLTLQNSLKKIGISTVIYASDFIHGVKCKRSQLINCPDDIYFIDAGSYKKNLSVSRLIYELRYSYKVCKILYKSNIKNVLIGEPILGAWFFIFLIKFKKDIKIYSDFIDLMPEAYQINCKNKTFFNILITPIKIIRWLRINYLYEKNFFVSQSYRHYLKCRDNKFGGIFYWGSKNFTRLKNNNDKRNTIIYAGSLGEGYDIETVLELARMRPELNILIAGSGPKSSLCEIAHKKNYICFLGQINLELLAYVYTKCEIGLLPYRKNSSVSMPIKLFEYINHQLKVVSSLKMECESIIRSYNIGISYEPGNVRSLSNAIDSAMNLQLNNLVIENLAEKFSIEYQYKEFAKKIQELIL